jgi:hypothetical protein
MREEAHLVMVANILSNNVIGASLVLLGMWLGRLR